MRDYFDCSKGLSVFPQEGKVIIFYSMLPNGERWTRCLTLPLTLPPTPNPNPNSGPTPNPNPNPDPNPSPTAVS